MKTSIIIVNYNTAATTMECLQSLRPLLGKTTEIIVIDNDSHDGSVAQIQTLGWVTLIESKVNLGFGAACNLAAEAANGEYLFFLNSDCLLEQDSLRPLVEILDTTKAAVVVPQILNSDGTVQENIARSTSLYRIFDQFFIGKMSMWYTPEERTRLTDLESFSGAAFIIRRNIFIELGGFGRPYFMYAEDVELSHRLIKAGYTIRYCPEARLMHYGGVSSGTANLRLERMLYINLARFYWRNKNPFVALIASVLLLLGYLKVRLKRWAKRL